MRQERKYRIENQPFEFVRQLVVLHPANFSATNPPRIINNIYFDTPGFQKFLENKEGISEREKWRIRWYGQDWNGQGKLEQKLKSNLTGKKVIEDLMLDKEATLSDAFIEVRRANSNALPMYPTLGTQYLRYYFETQDRSLRVTIDTDLQYLNLMDRPMQSQIATIFSTTKKGWYEDGAIIMELKFEPQWESHAGMYAQWFPFQLTKNSKYAQGLTKFFR